MTSTTLKHKRGMTFSYGDSFVMPAGTWSVAAQLYDANGVKVADLVATLTPPVGPATESTLLIEKDAASQAAWPIALLRGDIVFTDTSSPAVKLATSTFVVNVIEGQTQ